MPRTKKILPSQLLNELLEVAAESGDVQRLQALRSTLGEWALQQFMPDVAEKAKQLTAASLKQKESAGVLNLFNAPVGQAMGIVEKVEHKE